MSSSSSSSASLPVKGSKAKSKKSKGGVKKMQQEAESMSESDSVAQSCGSDAGADDSGSGEMEPAGADDFAISLEELMPSQVFELARLLGSDKVMKENKGVDEIEAMAVALRLPCQDLIDHLGSREIASELLALSAVDLAELEERMAIVDEPELPPPNPFAEFHRAMAKSERKRKRREKGLDSDEGTNSDELSDESRERRARKRARRERQKQRRNAKKAALLATEDGKAVLAEKNRRRKEARKASQLRKKIAKLEASIAAGKINRWKASLTLDEAKEYEETKAVLPCRLPNAQRLRLDKYTAFECHKCNALNGSLIVFFLDGQPICNPCYTPLVPPKTAEDIAAAKIAAAQKKKAKQR